VANVVVVSDTGQYVTGLISANGNVIGGNITTAGQLISTQTGSATTGAGQLYLNGATLNRIDYNTNGVAAPAFTTRSAGTKIALYPAIGGSAVDYALGVEAGALWSSIPGADGGQYFKWYGGETPVGSLSGTGVLSVTGNITGANLNTAGAVSAVSVSASGNVTGGNVLAGTGIISTSGNVTGGNLNAAGLSLSSNVVSDLNITSNIAGGNVTTPGLISATGNVSSGNVNTGIVSATGNVRAGNLNAAGLSLSSNVVSALNVTGAIAGANLTTPGLISATGNITGGNLITTAAISAGSVSASGNIIGGNLNAAGLSLSSNVVSNLNVTANITGGNITTPGLISATGNIQSGNINAVNLSLSGNIISALNVTGNATAGNIISVAAISGASVSASGNINSANVNTGIVSATGNILGGNINATTLSATGNVNGGNVNSNTIVGTGTTVKSTGDLTLSATGNIVVNSYINNVTTPVQDTDAANKFYVDSIAQGLHTHDSCNAATTTTLATSSGGTVTYNNGTSGVGATLTTTGSYTTIDGVTLTNGMRILVKNQADAAQNGIYDRTSSTVLTRSSDFDTPAEMAGGDFTFVTAGTQYDNTGWVMIDVVTTVGTSPVDWVQFSGAGTYTANTSAGLSLIGSVFNAKVDQITTAFDGSGNIIVKAGANLTTPNIGAATGTSLSTTGNITGGVVIGNTISTIGNVVSGNVNTGNISLTGNVISNLNVTGNVTGGNIISVAAISGASVSASGNVTGGNVLTGGLISSTGNITGGNVLGGANVNATTHTGTTVSVSGNITGGNVLGGANVNATTHTGTTVSVTGNITGGNLNAAGLSLSSNVVSALNVTGNIAGTNLTTPGLISATGNITGGNLIISGSITDSGQLDITTTSANANIVLTPNGTGNVNTGANVSVTGNVQGGNLRTAGLISATGNITGGNILGGANVNATTLTGTTVSVTGNITGGNILGGANVNATTHTGTTVSVSGNITGGNILGGANVNATTHTGTTVSVTGAITGGSLTVSTGTVTLGNIINANGNAVGNIGSSSVYFNTLFAKATSAQYADLAEMYLSDADYAPGIVLIFGGAQEVTADITSHSTAIAGVVSEKPSHLMNAGLQGKHVVAVALLGRVPCQVQGTVRKGDLLVASDTTGVAQRLNPDQYRPGCVIGKALANYDSDTVGTIEIAVGVK
jgi:filamentous hemagglutinin